MNSSGMTVPDGMPLVWLARAAGFSEVKRVYGPDLMTACIDQLRNTDCRHFLYGGYAGAAEDLSSILMNQYPGANIVGAYEPPFGSVADLCSEEAAQHINAANADVVWVGIGTPKQDLWMAHMRPRLTSPVLIGVGAAFDFHTGRVRSAPAWMKASGLEWLFRLSQDPRRLWRRYLVGNSWFVLALLLQLFRIRTHRPVDNRVDTSPTRVRSHG